VLEAERQDGRRRQPGGHDKYRVGHEQHEGRQHQACKHVRKSDRSVDDSPDEAVGNYGAGDSADQAAIR
jgi:hypothetical protein